MNLKRSALILIGLSCLATANAFSIDLISVGTATNGSNVVFNESVIYQNTSVVMPSFTVDTYSIINNSPPQPGSGMFSNGAGDSMSFDMTLNNISTNLGFVSGDGVWSVTGGTGAYTGINGGGTFAFNINGSTEATNSTFMGELNPAPEPASMIALGVGALGILSRRRRRS